MARRASIKLGRRLALLFGASSLAVILIGLFGLLQLRSVNATAAHLGQVWIPKLELAGELRSSVARHRQLMKGQLHTANYHLLLEIAQGMDEAIASVDAASRTYAETLCCAEERQTLALFTARWTRYAAFHHEIGALLDRGELAEAAAVFNEDASAAFDDAAAALDDLVAFVRREADMAVVDAGRTYERAVLLTIAAILAAGACAYAAAAWGRRHVSAPILAVAEAMRRLGSGDLRVEQLDAGRTEEIATLIAAVTGYRNSLVRGRALAEAAEIREKELLEAQRISRMGHWRLTVATGAVQWSQGAHEIMGTHPDEAVPPLDDFLQIVHPDDRDGLKATLDGCVSSRRNAQWEFRVTTQRGEDRVIWIDCHCERDAAGRVAALFGVCQDVTENRSLQASLEAARDAAEAASRAKSSFLATMSHELRTPLNAILGFSDLMKTEIHGPLGDVRYKEYAEDIHFSGRHLLTLINDILSMARIEAGRLELQEEPISLARSVREAVRLCNGSGSPGGTRVVLDLPEPDPVVVADPRLVKQMLVNLIGNAEKFTSPDTPIRVRASLRPEHLAIAVEDRGPGIPPDRLADLGKPFVQVESALSRRHEGSGMGLYIARSLAELHGGRLVIDSELGRGTTVTILLPIERVVAARPGLLAFRGRAQPMRQ